MRPRKHPRWVIFEDEKIEGLLVVGEASVSALTCYLKKGIRSAPSHTCVAMNQLVYDLTAAITANRH